MVGDHHVVGSDGAVIGKGDGIGDRPAGIGHGRRGGFGDDQVRNLDRASQRRRRRRGGELTDGDPIYKVGALRFTHVGVSG